MNKSIKQLIKQKLYESVSRKLMMEADDYRGRDLTQNTDQASLIPPNDNLAMDALAMIGSTPPKKQRQIQQLPPPTIIEIGNGWWKINGKFYHIPRHYRFVIGNDNQIIIVRGQYTPGNDFRRNPREGDIDVVRGSDGIWRPYVYHAPAWHPIERGNYDPNHPMYPNHWDDSGEPWDNSEWDHDPWTDPSMIPYPWNIPWRNRNENNPPFNNGKDIWKSPLRTPQQLKHPQNPRLDNDQTRYPPGLVVFPNPHTPGYDDYGPRDPWWNDPNNWDFE